jgi:hypothetical protein
MHTILDKAKLHTENIRGLTWWWLPVRPFKYLSQHKLTEALNIVYIHKFVC